MGTSDIATARVASTLPAGASPPAPEAEPAASALPEHRAEHSRFVQRIRRRYPAERAAMPPGLPGRDSIVALIEQLQRQGRDLGSAMRVARQLTLERLAVLDVEEGAPLADITRAMTELAEATLELALARARADQDARFGVPRNAAGEAIDFWVVGMGKLGARELNVSSDIDLIYVYEEDGTTDGARPVSAHEYFAQVARSLYTLIGEVTEDGFVFRVDLALRPNGNSGPAAVSLAMLEDYLQAHGREWERFAWLKSRVVAPIASVKSGRALALRSLVTAFVYRRYLDYGVFEGLRQLHAKVRDEAQRRAAGRPQRANDVKLSRGGIREIEFIVQLLLVVRGGHFPEIRTRSTLKALDKLAAGGLMKRASAERLAAAYTLLRRVEHRIQYLDDQQTHVLPEHDGDLAWIAASLGAEASGPCALLDRLGEAREFVAGEFDLLLRDGRGSTGNGCRSCGPAPQPVDAETFLAQLPAELAARVRPLCDQPKIRMLKDESKIRLAGLVGRAAQAVAEGRCTLQAAIQFVDWLEPLLRRESYLALLAERPEVQNRLLRLLGLARWPMRYLMLHPGVIDELADEELLHGRFDAAAYTARARGAPRRLAALQPGRGGAAPRHPAPRPPCRGVPHPGARRRGPHHGRAGRRRPLGAGRCHALVRLALGLEAPEVGAPARAAARGHRLRQARRQGARLRQRPRRRVRLRRSRDRRRQGGRGLRRLRAQGDQLADDAHRRRRAVRHRHGPPAERRLGPARHLDRLLRQLPDRPRQQHRLDLGAPGADPGALVRRARAAGAALRGGAAQRPRGAARPGGPAPPKSRRCARRSAPPIRSRPGASA